MKDYAKELNAMLDEFDGDQFENLVSIRRELIEVEGKSHPFVYHLFVKKTPTFFADLTNRKLAFYKPLWREVERLLEIELRHEEEQRRRTIKTGLQAAWEAAQDMDMEVEVYYIPPALPKKRKPTFSLSDLDITEEGF